MKSLTAPLATAILLICAAVFFSLPVEAAPPGLEVTITVTISQSVTIAWGTGTSTDDSGVQHPAGNTGAFHWIVKNTAGAVLNTGETVSNNDTPNSKTIKVSCLSQTGSAAAISASVSTPAGWSVGTATATNKFAILASLGAAPVNLDSTQSRPLGTVASGTANDQELILALTTPQAVDQLTDSDQVICVTLTGVVP